MARKHRPNPYLVFLSHSSKDTWVAKQIARYIEAAGAKAFLDEAEIEVGADFEAEILKSLAKASEFLVLLTPWSLDRTYVWAELGVAWGKGLRIVALLHGLTAPELQGRPNIPVFLKSKDLIELNGVEKYFTQLAQRVTKRLT